MIGWMTVIFCFSAQNADESAELSGGITEKIIELFVWDYDDLPAQQQAHLLNQVSHLVRKLAHFAEYCILGILLWTLAADYSIKEPWRGLLSWGAGTLYAVSDELHQMFSDGRSPQLLDVCIDSAGVVAGILFAIVFCAFYRRAIDRRGKKGIS